MINCLVANNSRIVIECFWCTSKTVELLLELLGSLMGHVNESNAKTYFAHMIYFHTTKVSVVLVVTYIIPVYIK